MTIRRNSVLVKPRASIIFNDFPELNINHTNLGEGSITATPQNDSMEWIGSDKQIQPIASLNFNLKYEVTASIVKTTNLFQAFLQRTRENTNVGSVTITPDFQTVSNQENIQLDECYLALFDNGPYDASQETFEIKLLGYMLINQDSV